MPKIEKVKIEKTALVKKAVKTKKPKSKLLKTPRTLVSKKNTRDYYDCLKHLVLLPENDRTKITALTHKCKCSKEEIAAKKAEVKHKLAHELANSYYAFGQSLGRYVKTDIVGCVKELGK